MGLYLCVFDDEQELDGVEVGSYADFNFFRGSVTNTLENGQAGSLCPLLINHIDCDGEWSVEEVNSLQVELEKIEQAFKALPPTEYNSEWKKSVAKNIGLKPKNLYECFFDVDGESIIERLKGLIEKSIESNQPILFQ